MGGYLKQGLKAGELTTQLPLIGSTNFETNEWQMEATAYASAKIFGERLLKSLVDSGNLKSAIAIRIGWAQMGENHPKTIDIHGSRKAIKGEITPLEEKKQLALILSWFQGMWLSNRDFERLCHSCITAKVEGYETVNGTSNNTGSLWDLSNARKTLGYQPQDDVTKALGLEES